MIDLMLIMVWVLVVVGILEVVRFTLTPRYRHRVWLLKDGKSTLVASFAKGEDANKFIENVSDVHPCNLRISIEREN